MQPKAIFHSLVDLLSHVRRPTTRSNVRTGNRSFRSVRFSRNISWRFNANAVSNIRSNAFRSLVKFIRGYRRVSNTPRIIFALKTVKTRFSERRFLFDRAIDRSEHQQVGTRRSHSRSSSRLERRIANHQRTAEENASGTTDSRARDVQSATRVSRSFARPFARRRCTVISFRQRFAVVKRWSTATSWRSIPVKNRSEPFLSDRIEFFIVRP